MHALPIWACMEDLALGNKQDIELFSLFTTRCVPPPLQQTAQLVYRVIVDDVELERRFPTFTVKLSASQRHRKHYEDRGGTVPSLLDYLLTRYWLQVQFVVIFDQWYELSNSWTISHS